MFHVCFRDIRSGKHLSARVLDRKLQDVLEIILDSVPTGCPRRQGEIKPRLVNIFDAGCNVELLARNIVERDGVCNVQGLLPEGILSDDDKQNEKRGTCEDVFYFH